MLFLHYIWWGMYLLITVPSFHMDFFSWAFPVRCTEKFVTCRGLWLQGKLHETLLEHIGQLAAEMKTSREQFLRTKLGKRKHEDDNEFKKVGPDGLAGAVKSVLGHGGVPSWADRLQGVMVV